MRSKYYHAKSIFYKCLAFAIGYGFTDCLFTYLLPFWVNARQPEFTWKYIINGLGAEVEFIQYILFSIVIFLNFGCKGKILRYNNIILPMLYIVYIFLPFIIEYI